jgi:hypothetical protein
MLGIVTFINIVIWLIHAASQSDPRPIAWASIPPVAGELWLFFLVMKWMFGFFDLQQQSITFEELLLQKLNRRKGDAAIVVADLPCNDERMPRIETSNTRALTLAKERNERNREIKRRAKERKAAAIAERREEQNQKLFEAVAESLDRDQVWRNEIAREHGWTVHPNDMEWLDESERKVMLEVWRVRGPFRQEWLNPKT